MGISDYIGKMKLYATHVVEVKVVRRNDKIGYGPNRTFLCTNSPLILDSVAGRSAFHFRPPSRPPAYNPKAKNVIFVYDLLMQDYRAVNMESDVVKAAMPVRNERELDAFWEYFATVMTKWNAPNKKMIMNM